MKSEKSRFVARVNSVAGGSASTCVSTPMRVKACASACKRLSSEGKQALGPRAAARSPRPRPPPRLAADAGEALRQPLQEVVVGRKEAVRPVHRQPEPVLVAGLGQ